jgi:fructokinase
MNLRAEEINEELIGQSRIFHFGSLSLTHPGVREATKKALAIAKEQGCLISYDPNLRPPLWNTLEEAKEQIAFGMTQCDIMKISDNEIQWFTGEEDFDAGIRILQDTYHIPLILLSLGRDGSRAYYKGMKVEVAPFLQENTIETTGAGDTFCACVINYVLDHGLENLTEQDLRSMLRYANAAASLITTRKGALRVMPSREDVERLLSC